MWEAGWRASVVFLFHSLLNIKKITLKKSCKRFTEDDVQTVTCAAPSQCRHQVHSYTVIT